MLCGTAFLVVLVVFFPAGAADLKNDVTLALLLLAGTTPLLPALLGPRLMTWPFTRRAAPRGDAHPGGRIDRRPACVGRRGSAGPDHRRPGRHGAGLDRYCERGEEQRAASAVRHGRLCGRTIRHAWVDRAARRKDPRHQRRGGDRREGDERARLRAPSTIKHLEAPTPIPFPAIGVDTLTALRLPVREGSLTGLNDRTVAVDTSWHKHVGDTMSLWLADGTPVTLRVAAVLGSGLGGGSLVLSPRNAGRSLPSRMYIRLRPGADRAAATAALLAAARTASAKIVPAARWSAIVSDRQAQQTRLGLIVLLGIAIAYSGIGAANTFLLSVGGRKRELALLRLAGASRHQALRVVTGESLLLALASIVLAAGVSAFLLGGLDTAFSGLAGTPPVASPWAFTGAIAAGGILTALAFSALPAWRILRR